LSGDNARTATTSLRFRVARDWVGTVLGSSSDGVEWRAEATLVLRWERAKVGRG